MPYVPGEARRAELVADHFLARTAGEVNFVFSTIILDIWNTTPRYDTLNYLRAVVSMPSTNPDFENMFYQVPRNSSLNQPEIRAALDNAWDEFYARVGRPYEELAIAKNGDLPGYKKAEEYIQKEFIKLRKSQLKELGEQNASTVISSGSAVNADSLKSI